MGKKQPRQIRKVVKKVEKRCIVGYKRATIAGSCHIHGEFFDKLEPCCEKFSRLFYDTGHLKFRSFDSRTIEERDGLNLLTWGNVLTLVLRISRSLGVIYKEKVTSCPFCETKIKVECTKSVELKPRKKEVPDGYDEEIKWQEGEQERDDKSAD